jgi:hypothetical protein
MHNNDLLKSVSQLLFNLFVVDDSKYGRQRENGPYSLIREKISVVTIDDMLFYSKSLLIYQEFHVVGTAFIKWICIDLDIAKKEIDQNDVNEENLALVAASAEEICKFLRSIDINFLLEFSGRRGFHIWVIFEELQTKENGHKLVNYIMSKVTLKPFIIADKFPKTDSVNRNTKMVGLGVKLPLSQNKLSGKLSYFLSDIESFVIDANSRPSVISESLLISQKRILEKYQRLTNDQLQPLLESYEADLVKQPKNVTFLKAKFIKVKSPEYEKLDSILLSLNQCDHIRTILTDYQTGLGAKDRMLLVGLLGRLQTDANPDLGNQMLLELFSRIHNFRLDLTEEKLRLSHYYYPVSCHQLGRCSYCTCKPIQSPIELIEGINIELLPPFSIQPINYTIFQKLKNALGKYMFSNDEIPLYHLFKKLETTSFNLTKVAIEDIYTGKYPPKLDKYEFLRNENDKVRRLYAIDPLNNIISTYFLFVLNNIFYTTISDNSFGYRISPGFSGTSIFANWFINWSQFSKKISHVLDNQEFEDYYIIKLDIKSFYDRIDLQRLEIKLYEEAPDSIALKLAQLSEDDRKRYRFIIKYLTDLSRKTTGNTEYGLPQGPAYARYLAELYLLGLDALIESEILKDKKREFYYRFVDDIFIFVETEPKAQEVLKLVDKWATINALELNKTKIEIENVAAYSKAGKFQRFQDDAKYLINKANKNKAILSDAEIQEALAKLDNITNDVKFGLKDNVRFFFYQFSGDTRLEFIKRKLIKFLPYAESGRGTLFMMFYADLIKTQPDIFWSLVSKQANITGLSLGHYLNTILLFDDFSEHRGELIQQLVTDVSNRSNLSDADKSLLITLARKNVIELSQQFLKNCSKNLIDSAMETPEIPYIESDFTYIEELLKNKVNRNDFVRELYNLIVQHPFDIGLSRQLARYVITRFSEWNSSNEFDEIVTDGESALEYYHCLCFFTLFYPTTDTVSLVTAWKNLLENSNRLKIGKPISFEWLNRAIGFPVNELSERNCYSLLLANKDGSGLDTFICPHDFLKQFQDILLVILFSKKVAAEDFNTDAMQFLDPDSHFGDWLKSPNARLYPDTDHLCVKNLALNGIIVLENSTHLFVKKISSNVNLDAFAYLPIDYKYKDEELEIKKGDKLNLYEPTSNLRQYLINLSQFIIDGQEFKATLAPHFPVFYKLPFTVNKNPAVPFYSHFEQKISPYGFTQNNDLAALWENAEYLSNFNNKDISLVNDTENPFDFTVSKLNGRFFPASELVIKTIEDKINFLQKFVDVMSHRLLQTIYEYQDIWAQTVWELLNVKGSGKSGLTEFLQVHFANFAQPEDILIDIFFSVNQQSRIESDNLSIFFNTIADSLIIFQSQLQSVGFSYSDLIFAETNRLDIYLKEQYEIDISYLKKAIISFRPWFNPETFKQETRLIIDGEPATGKPVLCFEHDAFGFYAKTTEELGIRVRGEFVFYHETTDSILIYVPELEFSKSFVRIRDRKEIQAIHNPKVRTVFPDNVIYEEAKAAYEGSDFGSIQKNLKNHYSELQNIPQRVISWLTIFNENTIAGSNFDAYLKSKQISFSQVYRSLLATINLHYPVTDESIMQFKEQLLVYEAEGAILFPLKHPGRDVSGLSRLLEKCGFPPRVPDFEKITRPLFSEDCTGKKLIIIMDAQTLGGQATSAFKHYLTVYKNDEEFKKVKLPNDQRYFPFTSIEETAKFRDNIEKIKEVVFLSPNISAAFEARMRSLEMFQDKTLTFNGHNILQLSDFIFGQVNFNPVNREIIEQLISDRELLKRIFVVPEDIGFDTYNTDPAKMNVLLRVGSLPSWHMRFMSMQPKNGVLPLLEYIDNWSR